MRKLAWGAIYAAAFVLAFGAGAFSNTLTASDFAGLSDADWNDSSGRIETDLTYADGALNTFDLYLPTDQERATKLVLYIHAGGFTSGDKADDESIAKSFAARGYVTATMNYSLSTDSNAVSVRDMTYEVGEAVEAIVTAASERGYDLDGMVIAGGSAGGNLAMTYAYRDAAQAPVPVEAVISLVGPASFEPSAWFGLEDYASREAAETGAAFVSVMTGQEITPAMMRSGEYRQALADITPSALVTPDAPPTLLAYGQLDKVAPYAASSNLPSILETNEVNHTTLVFPNSGHGLNRDPDLNDKLGQAIDDYLTTYAPLG